MCRNPCCCNEPKACHGRCRERHGGSLVDHRQGSPHACGNNESPGTAASRTLGGNSTNNDAVGSSTVPPPSAHGDRTCSAAAARRRRAAWPASAMMVGALAAASTVLRFCCLKSERNAHILRLRFLMCLPDKRHKARTRASRPACTQTRRCSRAAVQVGSGRYTKAI